MGKYWNKPKAPDPSIPAKRLTEQLYPANTPIGVVTVLEKIRKECLKFGYHPCRRLHVTYLQSMFNIPAVVEGYPVVGTHWTASSPRQWRHYIYIQRTANRWSVSQSCPPAYITRIEHANKRYGGVLYERDAELYRLMRLQLVSDTLDQHYLPSLAELHQQKNRKLARRRLLYRRRKLRAAQAAAVEQEKDEALERFGREMRGIRMERNAN